MAHYAKVLDNKVVNVIVAEAEFFDTFVDDSPGEWIQTSYNTRGGKHYDPNSGAEDSGTPVRKNFAAVGYVYDRTADAFYEPRPLDKDGELCESWTLNNTTYQWVCPINYPGDDKKYDWDESLYKSDNTKGWVERT